jgi:hypothetical protein
MGFVMLGAMGKTLRSRLNSGLHSVVLSQLRTGFAHKRATKGRPSSRVTPGAFLSPITPAIAWRVGAEPTTHGGREGDDSLRPWENQADLARQLGVHRSTVKKGHCCDSCRHEPARLALQIWADAGARGLASPSRRYPAAILS